MKISKIEEKANKVFAVTLSPNWIERMFGKKERMEEFKDSGRNYNLGGGGVYLRRNGEESRNGDRIGKAIDIYKRRW